MQFENSFDVPLPPEEAWRTLLNIEKVVPCVPGAELTEAVDDRTYKGKISVRLGPVSLVFAMVMVFEEIDREKLLVKASAKGSDTRGRGGTDAKIQFALHPIAEGTRVSVDTVLNLSGSVAQYGRASGVIRAVAGQITTEFANNLRARINLEQAAQAASPSKVAEPVPPQHVEHLSALRLLMSLLRSWWRGMFHRSRGSAASSEQPTPKNSG